MNLIPLRLRRSRRIFWFALSALVTCKPILLPAVTINFDDLPAMPNEIVLVPAASRLTNQLQPSTGAVFTSLGGFVSVVDAYNPNFGANHTISDPNLIAGSNLIGNLSYRSRVVVSFSDPNNAQVPAVTDAVSIRGDRFPFPGASALMEAYDVYGNFLNSSFAADVAAGLTLSVNAPGIHKVRISQVAPGAVGENGGIGFDNLTFNAVTPKYRGGFTRVLVSDNDSPPDGNGLFNLTSAPHLNDKGQVAFLGDMRETSGGTNDDFGIYRVDENFVFEIDRESYSDLFGIRKTLGLNNALAFNNAGQVAYHAVLTDPTQFVPYFDREHLLRGDGGPATIIAAEDQLAPDGNGKYLSFPDFTFNTTRAASQMNNAGTVAFPVKLADTRGGGQDDSGIYRSNGITVTQLDREFTGAFLHYTPHSPAEINSSGQVAYTATRGFDTPDLTYQVLRGDGTTVTAIAETGDLAPNGVGTFTEFGIPTINDVGQVAFTAKIVDGSPNDRGVFRSNQEGPHTQIARVGQSAPDGVSQFAIFGAVAINDFGQVAINASWGIGKSGIVIGNGNYLDAIAQTGQATPDGVGTFANIFTLFDFNNAGQALFSAYLTGTGVTPQNDEGLYVSDGKNIIQVAREGALWSPDLVTQVIHSADLNENGQVAFGALLKERFGTGDQRVIALYTPPLLPGDFNEDGSVDAADYVLWRDQLGFSGFDFPGDHDNSGVIDQGDYRIWRSHFGQSVVSGPALGRIGDSAVPEPGNVAMLFASLLFVLVAAPRR